MGLELTKDTDSRGLTEEGIIHIPGLLSRWVRLANGARAHYVTSGESGPAVILLHGGIEGSSGTAGFRFMCTMLGANGFRVYAPDRPGFGLSDVSKAEYLDAGARAQADFVKDFADALCLDKFHLSGNSSGCMISADVVALFPERVLSVAFIAGGLGDVVGDPRWIPSTEGKFTPNPNFKMTPFEGTETSMRNLMDSIIYEPKAIWPELITMRVRDALRQREARAKFGVKFNPHAIDDPNVRTALATRGRLDKLTTPMIYLYGLQDVLMTVENGFHQENDVPNVQFFYPDECGHQGQTDQPDMFNQVFLEFFRDGKVSWKTAEWAGVSRRRPIDAKVVEAPAGGLPKPIPEAYSDPKTLRAALAPQSVPA